MVDFGKTPETPPSLPPLFEAPTTSVTLPVLPLEKAKRRLENDVRWDCTATSAERQRENLTQRLKREFGLMTEDDVQAAASVSSSDVHDMPTTGELRSSHIPRELFAWVFGIGRRCEGRILHSVF